MPQCINYKREDQKRPPDADIDNKMETKSALLNTLSWYIKRLGQTVNGAKIIKLKDKQFIHMQVEYDLFFLQMTHLGKKII